MATKGSVEEIERVQVDGLVSTCSLKARDQWYNVPVFVILQDFLIDMYVPAHVQGLGHYLDPFWELRWQFFKACAFIFLNCSPDVY